MTGFTVAKTILEQLGGERFVMMTGGEKSHRQRRRAIVPARR
jgi:hypothetical protein